jgi:ATP/maltotriose-dependent transcriptional regulator MalT/DNA-binding MarR family transcriptional regulator
MRFVTDRERGVGFRMKETAEMFYFAPRYAGSRQNRAMARRYRRKRYYSTAERILIHLSTDGHPTIPRPETRTQEGIATATLSGRPTITKWLARLERRGLLVRERARVPGYALPKYTYRLSPDGGPEVERLQARLSTETLDVHHPSLGRLTMRVADVSTLTLPGLDLTTAVSLVQEGHLDLTRLPRRRTTPSEPLVWGESLRQVDHLFGRQGELRFLDRWYASPSKVLLVTGLAGIGKSTFVAGWVQRRRPQTHVFQFQVQRSTKTTALLASLGAFLAALGRRNLASRMSEEGPLDLRFVQRLLGRELAKLRTLVILDSLEQASREVARFVKETLLALVAATPMRLVLVSRSSPGWFSDSSGRAPPFEILRLRGLDPQASAALLRAKGFSGEEAMVRDVAMSARGHPLLLHLVAQGGRAKITAITRYLEEEVWATLSTEERAALETASVFRWPIQGPLLEVAAGVRRPIIASLRAKNLLEQTVTGSFFVHDLVRDFARGHTSEEHRRSLHERAARPLLRERDPRDRWEGIYHLLAGGRPDEAASLLESQGPPLVDSVAAAEITSLIQGLPLDQMNDATSCLFSEVLGDSWRILGHVGPSLRQYGYARRMAEAHKRNERIPRLLRKMAFLERSRNRYPVALGYLVEARARLHATPDAPEMTEVLRELALVEQAVGDLSKASEHLNEAVDLATESADRGALSRALLALGSLETLRGNREVGLEYDLEGLRIAERSGNLTEVSHAHIVVGTALAETGRFTRSLRHYDRGLELALLLGNLRLSAYATMNRTGALLDLERYTEARLALNDAINSFGILEERDTLALLKVYEGQLEMGLGHWTRARRAWEKGLSALQDYGSPVDLARALKEVGGFCLEREEFEDARVYLLKARELARKIGNKTLLSETERALLQVERPLAPRLTS